MIRGKLLSFRMIPQMKLILMRKLCSTYMLLQVELVLFRDREDRDHLEQVHQRFLFSTLLGLYLGCNQHLQLHQLAVAHRPLIYHQLPTLDLRLQETLVLRLMSLTDQGTDCVQLLSIISSGTFINYLDRSFFPDCLLTSKKLFWSLNIRGGITIYYSP